MLTQILLLVALAFAERLYKTKMVNVNVLVPDTYLKMYEYTHPSLGTDLMTIALAFESAFNNSTEARSNNYQVKFEIFTPLDNPVLLTIGPQTCEGSVQSVLNLLYDINRYDNTRHYILLLPCEPRIYSEVFASVGVDVPIIEDMTNVQCSRRVAVFFEMNFQQMFSSFSNALLKILGAPPADYTTITESALGDEGLKSSITINDNTVHSILNSKCFLNIPTQ